MLPETEVEFENGEPVAIRTTHWENVEKIFGTKIALKIKKGMGRS